MKNVKISILCCSLLCVLTACGGSSSDRPKSSSSSLSSSSVSSSSTDSSESSSDSSESSVSSSSSSVTSSVSSESSSSQSDSSESSSSTTSSDSSSESSSSVAVVAQTGVFVDSAVAGVMYQTTPGDFSGVTSETGQYQFAEGDTVVFSIGAIEFPPVMAKGVVTPVDMAESGNPTDPIVVNIAVLLQSLDADGDPSNGIEIPAEAVAAADQSVDFNQTYESFAAAVLPLVQHSDSNKTVVSDVAALAHLEESLRATNATSLVGAWYYLSEGFEYALFILDESRYAAIDNDIPMTNGTDYETGTYEWNQSTGIVTLASIQRSDNNPNTYPPMANGNTLELNGDELTLTDSEDSFVLQRLMPTEESPLKGGWSIIEEGVVITFAFTDTHYLMGQMSEEDETGQSGSEIGTYTYNADTGEFVVTTLADTNGQWGLSHPCAVLDLQESNDLSCGSDGSDIMQTLTVTGDTLTFISEADTIAYGEEEPVLLERINGVPDGDIHLKLELTLTLTDYTQGDLFTDEGATMQCDLGAPREVGEVEMLNESWVLGSNPNRATWMSNLSATYNPETKVVSFNEHSSVAPIAGHAGFFQESWDDVEVTYNAGESNVITGTYTEIYNLTWDRDDSVSTCEAVYSVVGVLR